MCQALLLVLTAWQGSEVGPRHKVLTGEHLRVRPTLPHRPTTPHAQIAAGDTPISAGSSLTFKLWS